MVLTKFDIPASADHQSAVNTDSNAGQTITLVHLSDPHISCMNAIRVQDLLNKRIFGYLRWKLHRAAEHDSGVLAALQTDLAQTRPDHIAVTGDLTHLSLPAEFIKAGQWLQSLGPPDRVTVIPGNHDAYIKRTWRKGWVHWIANMIGDDSGNIDYAAQNPDSLFPYLRVRGPVALIGVCTAQPTAPHLAIGTVGNRQLQKLESVLARISKAALYRIVLIHHPPSPGSVSRRKRLTDAAALRSLIYRYGADLILHGHAHRALQGYIKTPRGPVPVMGAPSVSALGRTPDRRARYYIYRITSSSEGWRIDLKVRVYSIEQNGFITERDQRMSKHQ